MKAVHFGAGNIGRGFIGLLLSDSGFEVTFVARNEKKVQLLRQQKRYTVTLAGEAEETAVVRNVTAVGIGHTDAVAQAVSEADLVTTAVGVAALEHIAESIAAGITRRLRAGNRSPLHVIACENAIGGSSQLKRRVAGYMPAELRELAETCVAYPDTAVDRIVPDQAGAHPLEITVEPYFEWVIDRSAMLDGFPPIKGAKFVDRLEPYIERKLFTVNTGHCAAAYRGYLEGYGTIQEAMADCRLRESVQGVLRETGKLLTSKYEWDEGKHDRYIAKMLRRFANPRLIDEIVRVGRSPLRKLGLHDRLVRPMLQAHRLGLGTDRLADAAAAALLFDYDKDPEAVKLQQALRQHGIDDVIANCMGIPAKHAVHETIKTKYAELKGRYRGFQA